MRYKKKENEQIDNFFKSANKHGMNVRFSKEALFFRKGFHWEYVLPEEVERIYRRVEEVITHTSCCAENMDIQKFIVILKSKETLTVHVCDGEPRLAERLYSDIQEAWTNVAFGNAM